jgi:hypothetical protein
MEWVGLVDAAAAAAVRARIGDGTRTVGRGNDGLVALRVENDDPDAAPALARLREPGWRGLLFAGDLGDVTAVVTADGGDTSVGLLPFEPDAAASVVAWCREHTKLTPGRRKKLDDALSRWAGPETADEVLRILGYRLDRQDAWRLLGEAIQPPHGSQPRFVGELEVDLATFRYALASGLGFTGIWDWASPEEPVERFPKGTEGGTAAQRRWAELAYLPVLTGQRLDGPVLWRAAHRKSDRNDVRVSAVHRGPTGMFFEINPGPLPRTALWVDPGSTLYPGSKKVGPPKVVVNDLADMARALDVELAWLLVPLTEWQPLPGDAPRDLLALNEWLLDRARELTP